MLPRSEAEVSLPTPTKTDGLQIRSSPPPFDQYISYPEDMESADSEPMAKEQTEDAQLPLLQRASSAETERPPSAQRFQENVNGTQTHEHEEEAAEEDVDPAEEIEAFDWQGLEQRYHDVMKSCQQHEDELLEEWTQLMKFFRAWAETGHDNETNRTFSRLRTRMAHVQNSEDELEKTRDHYVRVVGAFESALKLLRDETG